MNKEQIKEYILKYKTKFSLETIKTTLINHGCTLAQFSDAIEESEAEINPMEIKVNQLEEDSKDLQDAVAQLKNGKNIEGGDYETIKENVKSARDGIIELSEALSNLRIEINKALNQMDLKKKDKLTTKIGKIQIKES